MMNSRKAVVVLAAIVAAACSTTLQPIAPIPCPADFTPREELPAGATRARATAFELPRWRKAWGPMNARALAIIDTAGRVNPDSVMVCGLDAHPKGAEAIARSVASMQFVPAKLNGRPIRSLYPLVYFESKK